MTIRPSLALMAVLLPMICTSGAAAAGLAPSVDTGAPETAMALRVAIGLTVLSLLPAMLVCMTAFLRIIIVLSMLRHAFGMQETPPNAALLGLSLFLTLFVMAPVVQDINQHALQPFMQGSMSIEDAYTRGAQPLRAFMVKQTREEDLALMLELSGAAKPQTLEPVSYTHLPPA